MKQRIGVFLRPLRYPNFVWAALVWPLLLLPALVFFGGRSTQYMASEASTYSDLRLAVHHQGQAADLLEQLRLRKDLRWIEARPEDFRRLLQLDSLDIALIFDPNFDEALQTGKPAPVQVYLRRGADGDYQRLLRSLKAYDEQLVRMRLEALGGNPSLLQATEVKPVYIGETDGVVRRTLYLLLTLLAWLFAYLACAHSAVYLFILSPEQGHVPGTLAVGLWGFLSGLLTWLGLYAAMRLSGGLLLIPLGIWTDALNAKTVLIALVGLLSLSAFFAAAIVPVCRRIQSPGRAFWLLRLGFVLALILWGVTATLSLNYAG